ncbi:energy-coupling factor transporter transmembrane protein EcfT [Clostridia bacterium]|nr:energy-coupling factor transporter transmembrane protein EcfT [Clostridia bacterium]
MQLRDITIGQYFPMESPIHKMDARFKILLTGVFIAMLFYGDSIFGLVIGALFVVIVTYVSKISFTMLVKSIKPIVPILIFTGLLNLFFLQDGEVYFHWKFIKITQYGVETSVFMLFRIILLVCGSSLLTYTTSPIVLTDAIESLLKPLKKIKMPVHELAMMMTIALRFIPTLIEETDKIMCAQKSRGADLETGGIVKRAKALLPILIPLFVSAFRRAEELATAMECRCYHGGEGRTRLKVLKSTYRDYIGVFVTLLFFAAIIIINKLPF